MILRTQQGAIILTNWVIGLARLRSVLPPLHLPAPPGSKYPIFEVSGSNNHTLDGLGNQGPERLGILGMSGPTSQISV